MEILNQIPWQCHEKDCTAEGTWHLASYVFYWEDGVSPDEQYMVDFYTDGDSEPLDGDLPTDSEEREAWNSYYRWVAANGRDPLGQLLVSHVEQQVQTWLVEVEERDDGVHLKRAKREGEHWRIPEDLPKHFASYMLLTGWPPADDEKWASLIQEEEWKTIADMAKGVAGASDIEVVGDGLFRVTTDFRVPRDAEVVRRELIEVATRGLRLGENGDTDA